MMIMLKALPRKGFLFACYYRHMQSQALLEKHTAIFNYQEQAITFRYWTHTSSLFQIDTVIFLGTGQMGKIPKWVATLAPPGVAVIEGLPHWKADPSGRDLKRFSEAYTLSAFKTVLANHRLDAAHVIGVSQAAPGVLWMAVTLPALIRNVSLVEPLGLTKRVFGTTDTARLRTLKKRALRSMLQFRQSPFYSPRNLYALLLLLRVRLLETERGASDRKYAEGLSHDMLEECRQILKQQLSKHARFLMFLGGKDVIFPYSEVNAALDEAGLKHIKVIILPKTAHTSFTARQDKAALRRIVTTTRSKPEG